MARQRFIWPDLWTDPEIGRMEPVVQLFFIGCFSNADDEGRLLGDVAYLRSTIFAYRDFTLEQVVMIKAAAVSACSNLVAYEVDGVPYLAFRKWSNYQKPKYPKPSKLPAPPKEKSRKSQEKSSGNDGGTMTEPSSEKEEAFTPRVGQGRVGLGNKGRSEANYAVDLPIEIELAKTKLLSLAPKLDVDLISAFKLPPAAWFAAAEELTTAADVRKPEKYVYGLFKSWSEEGRYEVRERVAS